MLWFPKTTIAQAKDTGILLGLVLLMTSVYSQRQNLLPIVMVILFFAMLSPGWFMPFARLWFGLAHFLGQISSKFILTLVFFLLVTPMGLLRRVAGKDAMRLKGWKNGEVSVLVERKHRYLSIDLERPY